MKTAVSGWFELSERIVGGGSLTREDALSILRAPDTEILEILAAAYRVRRHFHGTRVCLNFLINAKSGLCGEDCAYCSQSKVSTASVARYPLVDEDRILEGARIAVSNKASTYCIATSGRSPSPAELDRLVKVIRAIKQDYPLRVCLSPGLLDADQARRLKAAGLDRINHNLNTSRAFYPTICSTHTYDERLATLRAAREAGLELCCGGLIGMGETEEDVADFALTLAEFQPEAVPINFLIPIEGTPLQGHHDLSPLYCLKVLAVLRFANPRSDLRIAAGREIHLGPLQPLGLFAANSIFVGGYLTTRGQPPEQDFAMIQALGFEIEQVGHAEG